MAFKQLLHIDVFFRNQTDQLGSPIDYRFQREFQCMAVHEKNRIAIVIRVTTSRRHSLRKDIGSFTIAQGKRPKVINGSARESENYIAFNVFGVEKAMHMVLRSLHKALRADLMAPHLRHFTNALDSNIACVDDSTSVIPADNICRRDDLFLIEADVQ